MAFIKWNTSQRRAQLQPLEPCRARRLFASFEKARSESAASPIRMDEKRTYTGRIDQRIEERVILAFDVVDISRAYGNVQQRFGAEYTTRRIAFRGGYNTQRGFSIGIGYGFISLAFGARAPLEITQSLRF